MDWILIVSGSILILLGIIGCLLPILPGPPLSWVGLLLVYFTDANDVTLRAVIVLGILALIVQILDYIVPVWGTKKFGGTKYGTWGSVIGLVAGIILLPMLGIVIGPFGLFGILGGPFVGALIGEKIGGQDNDKATRAAFGSFIGFLTGTLMKLVTSGIITWFFVSGFLK